MTVHLVKLCVGADSIDDLERYRARVKAAADARGETWQSTHVTRMSPKRADEILDGGSLYWVIKRVIQVRQRIIGLEEVIGDDGIKRCAIVMDNELVRTAPAARRPFQGWRYLKAEDAPRDLSDPAAGGANLPDELRRKLLEIGAW
jgi:hypothetical protein